MRAVALTAACRGAANSAGKKGSSLPPTGGETRQARRPLGLGRLLHAPQAGSRPMTTGAFPAVREAEPQRSGESDGSVARGTSEARMRERHSYRWCGGAARPTRRRILRDDVHSMGSHFLCVNFPVCSRRQRRPRVGEIRRHRCRGQGPDPFGCIGSFYEGLVCVSSSGSLFGCCGVGAARLGAQAAPSSPLQPPRDVGRGRLSAGSNISVQFARVVGASST